MHGRPNPLAASLAVYAYFFLLALAVRCHNLGKTSLWLDEILQLQVTSGPWSGIWSSWPANKPPTDYYIQWFFVRGSRDETRARLHACLLGASIVAALGMWARAMGGRLLSLVAMLLALGWPLLVRFSQEGRGYSLLMLSECLFLAAFWKAFRSPKPVKPPLAIALAATVLLCIWTHYFCVMACVLTFAFALAHRFLGTRPRAEGGPGAKLVSDWRLPAILAGLVLLSAVPVYLLAVKERAAGFYAGWDVENVAQRASTYLDIYAFGYEWTQYRQGARWALLAAMAIGWLGWLGRERRIAANFCAFLFLSAFAGSFLLFWKSDHWMEVRYTLAALPPAIVLCAMGIETVGRLFVLATVCRAKSRLENATRPVWVATGVLAVALSALFLVRVHADPVKRLDWREAVERIGQTTHAPRVVITNRTLERIPLEHYLSERGIPATVICCNDDSAVLHALLELHKDAWLVFPTDGMSPAIRETVERLPAEGPPLWRMAMRRNSSPPQ